MRIPGASVHRLFVVHRGVIKTDSVERLYFHSTRRVAVVETIPAAIAVGKKLGLPYFRNVVRRANNPTEQETRRNKGRKAFYVEGRMVIMKDGQKSRGGIPIEFSHPFNSGRVKLRPYRPNGKKRR